MIEIKEKMKRWGRSFGVVVPMEKLRNSNIGENETIEIIITKQKNPLKKHFGSFKFKKSIDEMLKEADEEDGTSIVTEKDYHYFYKLRKLFK